MGDAGEEIEREAEVEVVLDFAPVVFKLSLFSWFLKAYIL